MCMHMINVIFIFNLYPSYLCHWSFDVFLWTLSGLTAMSRRWRVQLGMLHRKWLQSCTLINYKPTYVLGLQLFPHTLRLMHTTLCTVIHTVAHAHRVIFQRSEWWIFHCIVMSSLWKLHIVYPDHEIWTAEIEILLWASLHQEQFIAFTERDTAAKHLKWHKGRHT